MGLDASLARFVRERGLHLLGARSGSKAAFFALAGSGLLYGLLGAFFLWDTQRNVAKADLVGIGYFFLLAALCFGVGARFAWRKYKNLIGSEPRLSVEGQRLLMRLAEGVGWGFEETASYAGGWHGIDKVDLLSKAAESYNRISDLLGRPDKAFKASIGRMRLAMRTATDEAMIGIINQVGALQGSRSPSRETVSQLEADIASMQELADRIERLQQDTQYQEEPLTGEGLREILAQLQMEEEAIRELDTESVQILRHQASPSSNRPGIG